MSEAELQATTQVKSCYRNIYKNKVFFKIFCWFNWYKSHQKLSSAILQSECSQNILSTCNFRSYFRCLFGKFLASLSSLSPSPTMKGEKQSCKNSLCNDFRHLLLVLQMHIEIKRTLDIKQFRNISRWPQDLGRSNCYEPKKIP